jgi:hypothetical protein
VSGCSSTKIFKKLTTRDVVYGAVVVVDVTDVNVPMLVPEKIVLNTVCVSGAAAAVS